MGPAVNVVQAKSGFKDPPKDRSPQPKKEGRGTLCPITESGPFGFQEDGGLPVAVGTPISNSQ